MAQTSGSDTGIASTVFASAAGNNNGTTTLITTSSKSSGYNGASGNENFGAAARTGSFDSSSSVYFEVTITPTAGHLVAISNISFGTRSTSTGPQSLTIRSSVDGYAAPAATVAVANTSTWVLTENDLSIVGDPNEPVIVRIYGSNGAGNPSANTANWRIDDISIFATGLAPTAGKVRVSGQVVDTFGSGVSGATVMLMSATGERSVARTSPFGYFAFEDVESGATYIVNVSSKRYRFEPRSVTVGDNIDDLRLTALP
ncbi:MAG: carboxypeptidase-like regulatory domain-containing protein [Pyrinomonadaceae bacterium]